MLKMNATQSVRVEKIKNTCFSMKVSCDALEHLEGKDGKAVEKLESFFEDSYEKIVSLTNATPVATMLRAVPPVGSLRELEAQKESVMSLMSQTITDARKLGELSLDLVMSSLYLEGLCCNHCKDGKEGK